MCYKFTNADKKLNDNDIEIRVGQGEKTIFCIKKTRPLLT